MYPSQAGRSHLSAHRCKAKSLTTVDAMAQADLSTGAKETCVLCENTCICIYIPPQPERPPAPRPLFARPQARMLQRQRRRWRPHCRPHVILAFIPPMGWCDMLRDMDYPHWHTHAFARGAKARVSCELKTATQIANVQPQHPSHARRGEQSSTNL